MSPRSKREYVEAVFLRYKQAGKIDKGRLLSVTVPTADHRRRAALNVITRCGLMIHLC
jgi:hypothetical protein